MNLHQCIMRWTNKTNQNAISIQLFLLKITFKEIEEEVQWQRDVPPNCALCIKNALAKSSTISNNF